MENLEVDIILVKRMQHQIVMTAEDVAKVHAAAPDATVIVVHLEAINHCLETRAHYRERLPALGVDMDHMSIPDDGEAVEIGH